jgi:NAD(P)-dependent dehydrogenase (short-subunit alcohol dehydrogenase family)
MASKAEIIGSTDPTEHDTAEAVFDRNFDINFKGPFFLIQALRPLSRVRPLSS